MEPIEAIEIIRAVIATAQSFVQGAREAAVGRGDIVGAVAMAIWSHSDAITQRVLGLLAQERKDQAAEFLAVAKDTAEISKGVAAIIYSRTELRDEDVNGSRGTDWAEAGIHSLSGAPRPCSFCGRCSPEVSGKVVEGPGVRICIECVRNATAILGM